MGHCPAGPLLSCPIRTLRRSMGLKSRGAARAEKRDASSQHMGCRTQPRALVSIQCLMSPPRHLPMDLLGSITCRPPTTSPRCPSTVCTPLHCGRCPHRRHWQTSMDHVQAEADSCSTLLDRGTVHGGAQGKINGRLPAPTMVVWD